MGQRATDYLHKASVYTAHLCSVYHENRKMYSQAGHIAHTVFLYYKKDEILISNQIGGPMNMSSMGRSTHL